jgi:uncharacterized protein
MGNPVVHFEINGINGAELATFYAELLGWKTEVVPGDYVIIDTQAGSGINGGIGTIQDGSAPNVRFYASGPDPQAMLDKAESLGAKVVTPVTEIPDMVVFATFDDPQGNRVGVVKEGEGPGVSPGDGAPLDWFEVLGPDPDALKDFYTQLFGWTVKESDSSGGDWKYFEVQPEPKGIGGGIGSTPDGKPHVNIYANVDDVQKYLERAESLGGKIVMTPQQVGDHLTFGMLADPQGILFGLYRYQRD